MYQSAAGVDNAFSKGVRCKNFGNFMRHHKSASHVGALETLGLAEASEDALLQGAPSIESFQQVLDHRCKDRALRQGCAAGGGKKMARMEHCLQSCPKRNDGEPLTALTAASGHGPSIKDAKPRMMLKAKAKSSRIRTCRPTDIPCC